MNEEYTGKYVVGQVVMHKGHECEVVDVWTDFDNGKNGVTIKPTGNYGFPIDIYEEQV